MQRLENAPFTLQYTFRQYDGCEPVAEVSRRMTVVSSFADEVDFGGARWRVELAWCATPQDADGLVCEVQVTALGGDADNVSFAVEAVWEDWSTGHYVMLPAAVYAGNRFKGRRIVYPPVPEDAANMGPDAPPLISDIPRLNIGPGPSRIQLTAGEMATPAICIRDPNRNLGFVWLTHQQTAKGDAGFRIAESEDRTRAVVSLMAPMVREESVYGNTRMDNPSDDCGADFHSGDCLEFAFHLHCFAAEDIPALFARFFALRKTMTGPTAYVHQIPWSAAFRIQEDEYNARRWNDEFGHYAVGLMQGRYDDWQIGWVGGMMATYPMLFQGNALSRERARRNFDFACTTQAEAGFFWPVHSNGRCIGDYFRKDDGGNWLLVRRMGDALY
ncbi:MAG TPA: hypothetical protein HPP77_08175, partial [Candidatus Hydrogenedentes bacterium]|nr:hypothetical protein [Candidatus Hydrogenedentota bacterium]